MFTYHGGEGDPVVIFYHEPTDVQGCILEARRRREIEAIQDEMDLERVLTTGRGFAAESIMPIPNTSDVLGVLKGEVNLARNYKKLGTCSQAEAERIQEFLHNYRELLTQEEATVRQYIEDEDTWGDHD
jgi:hypothetical protein